MAKSEHRRRDRVIYGAEATEGEGHRDIRMSGNMPYSHRARVAAVARAEQWTERQAERLGYTPKEIMAAIGRGWTAQEVEALAVAEADQLEGVPPRVRAVAARIRNAPILPVVWDTENRGRRRSRYVDHGPSPYRRIRRSELIAV